MSRYSTSKQ